MPEGSVRLDRCIIHPSEKIRMLREHCFLVSNLNLREGNMEVFFNTAKGKSSRLIDAFRSNVDNRKKYQLSIFTCYLADDLAKISNFIDEISSSIKLIDVKLYIDARECIRIGIEKLREFEKSYADYNIGFEVTAIDTPNLFHSKAYALLSHDEQTGVLAVGSANFSNAGLFSKRNNSNYETLLLTNDVETVKEFLSLQDINEKKFKNLEELEEYKKESYSFKYALLQQGKFVHKWSETFNQYFAIRYKLSEKGKSEIGNDILKNLGFTVDTETISRQFFDFSSIKKNDEVDEQQFNSLLRRGLETFLGHWLPLSLLQGLDDEVDAEHIFEILSNNVGQQLEGLKQHITEAFEKLKNEGFIAETDLDKDPILELESKLNNLKDDHVKLSRMWNKFYAFYLPYDLSRKNDIETLYDDLIAKALSKKRKNAAVHGVLKAKDTLRPIAVSEYCVSHEQEDDTVDDENIEE